MADHAEDEGHAAAADDYGHEHAAAPSSSSQHDEPSHPSPTSRPRHSPLAVPYPMRRHGRPSSSFGAPSSSGSTARPASFGGRPSPRMGLSARNALHRDEEPLQYARNVSGGSNIGGGIGGGPQHHDHPMSNGSHDDELAAHHHHGIGMTNNNGGEGYPPHGNGNTGFDATKSPGRFTQAYRRHGHGHGHHPDNGQMMQQGESDHHGYQYAPPSTGDAAMHHPQHQHHHDMHPHYHPHAHPHVHAHPHHNGGRRRHLILTKVFQCTVLLIIGVYTIIVRRGTTVLDGRGGMKRDWWSDGFGSGGSGGGANEPPGQRGVGGGGGMKGIFGPGGNSLGGGDGGDAIHTNTNPHANNDEDTDALLYDGRPITTVSAERAVRWKADEIGRARGNMDSRADARRRRTVPRSVANRNGNGNNGDGVGNDDAKVRQIEDALRTSSRHSFALLDENRSGMPPPMARPLHAEPEIPPVDRDATNADGSPLTEEQIQEKEEARKKQLDAQIDALERLEAASAEELCGSEARDASKAHPVSYLRRDVLNDQSRVLITGILNPIGFHLALALKKKCGVQTIMGIDNMFPNSILNRLEMVRRMSILSKEIPGFSQPIMLPYVGLDPRLNLKKIAASGGGPHGIDIMLPSTGEINFLTFRPTHVVHLASAYDNSYRDDAGVREGKHHIEHVYGTENRTPPMYQVRTAGAGMEHILTSIATAPDDTASGRNFRPHLVYASSRSIVDVDVMKRSSEKSVGDHGEGDEESTSPSERFHPAIKVVDEVLASTYSSLYGVYSVGLRLGDVYGPWGVQGSPDFDLAEVAVADWERHSRQLAESRNGENDKDDAPENFSLLRAASLDSHEVATQKDLLFVDDTVDAIIAAMQFRKEDEAAAVFDLLSDTDNADNKVTLESVASAMESLMPGNDEADEKKLLPSKISAKKEGDDGSMSPKKHLGWSPVTSVRDGIARLLAWHLDERSPYGPDPNAANAKGKGSSPANKELDMGDDDEAAVGQKDGKSRYLETGNEFLQRTGFPTCPADDDQCHRGNHIFPCASECVPTSGTCKASIYDGVVDLTKDVTAGCDIVLYTTSLGYDVEQLQLKATHRDDDEEDGYELSTCNVAFVPSGSQLVDLATTKVPQNALEDIQSDEDKAAGKPVPEISDLTKEEKLVMLNGRILHRGWVLVWVPDTMDGENADEMWLPKLTPGRLMHEDVQYAMFVDEFFTVTPNIDDVQFLVSEMHRPALRERPFHKVDENGKKIKFILPAEPERRAAIMMNNIKQKKSKDEETGDAEKISVYDAAKFMVYENGGDPSQSDPKPLKRQREFYERVTSFVNRDDLRSVAEPVHKYEMKHWIRSRWVIHDLKTEEGRQIRCDWFREHAHWGNPLDQLSFAHVMAVREVERKFTRNEPDDRMRAQLPQEPEEIADIGDKKEWHRLIGPAESYEKKLEDVGRIGRGEDDVDEEANAALASVAAAADEDRPGQLYARILSDKIMLICRKIWTENRKKVLRALQRKKEREEAQAAIAQPPQDQ